MVCLGPLLAKVCRSARAPKAFRDDDLCAISTGIWKAACVARSGITQEVICSLPENIFEISLLIQRGCGI